MVDNIDVTPGSGKTIAADEIGGVLYQRVKLALGGDGSASDLTGENHLGEVGGKTIFTDITFSLDTIQYAAGDVLADTQLLAACLRKNDGTGRLDQVIFRDEDDQGQGFDVYILKANTSLGTENSAPNISDVNARNIIGQFSVTPGDYKDLGGVKIAMIRFIGLSVIGASGTDDVYVALVSQGTGTYTASGITATFVILCD